MWSYRRSRRRSFDSEAALRSYRAEPRDDFVRALSERVHAEPSPRRRTAWSRLAFAGAVSTLIVGMFASFGGFSYAASGAASTYTAVKQIVVNHKVTVRVHTSSASDQYAPAPKQVPKPAARQVKAASAVAGAQKSNTLPFTGYSLLATVLVGAMLLGLGLILRRRERSDT